MLLIRQMLNLTIGVYLNRLASYKLFVIDEWLINDLTQDDIQFLFELFEIRYDRSSTIFVSQYKTADWHTRLGGSLHADAIMDRIVHNSITIESGNVNMRERVHKTINKNIICKTYLAHIHSP